MCDYGEYVDRTIRGVGLVLFLGKPSIRSQKAGNLRFFIGGILVGASWGFLGLLGTGFWIASLYFLSPYTSFMSKGLIPNTPSIIPIPLYAPSVVSCAPHSRSGNYFSSFLLTVFTVCFH